MSEENKTNSVEEPTYRVNIKQSAKGFAYYDVTIRANTPEEMSLRLNEAIEVATVKCAQINATLGD